MHLVNYNDSVLHSECEPFDFNNPQCDIKELSDSLHKLKREHNGLGLAAPQVGISLSVFAFLDETAINPEIIEEHGPYVAETEGCLSYPGLWIQTKRPTEVRVKYHNIYGVLFDRYTNSRLECLVFCHEYDHLKGVTFVDKASNLKLRRSIEKANKHGFSYTIQNLRYASI